MFTDICGISKFRNLKSIAIEYYRKHIPLPLNIPYREEKVRNRIHRRDRKKGARGLKKQQFYLNVASLIKSQSSIQSTFSGLYQLQLILLLPLIGAFIPSKVVQFIAGMNFAIVIMSYANISYLSPQELQKLRYGQPSSYLYLINIKDGSSIFN